MGFAFSIECWDLICGGLRLSVCVFCCLVAFAFVIAGFGRFVIIICGFGFVSGFGVCGVMFVYFVWFCFGLGLG